MQKPDIKKIIDNNIELIQRLLNIGFKIAGNSLVRLSKSSKINIITIYDENKFILSLSESVLDNGTEYTNLEDVVKYFESLRPIYHSEEELNILVNKYEYIDEYYGMDVFIISKDGVVVYRYKKESDLGQKLSTGYLYDSPLAEAYNQAAYTLGTALVDVAYHPPSKLEAALAVTPIFADG